MKQSCGRFLGLSLALSTVLLFTHPQAVVALSNSVNLIGGNTGPIANFLGEGINIGVIDEGIPNTNHVYLMGTVGSTTNIGYVKSPDVTGEPV